MLTRLGEIRAFSSLFTPNVNNRLLLACHYTYSSESEYETGSTTGDPMGDAEMVDMADETEAKVEQEMQPISLDVFQFVKTSQSQHGLKHNDYSRYRPVLTSCLSLLGMPCQDSPCMLMICIFL